MLLRADPSNDTLSMLSFPRDLVVDHPGCPAHPDPWTDRINTAFTFCGPTGTVRTVKELTGVPINYVITVNFSGFKQIVNKVGRGLRRRRPPLLQRQLRLRPVRHDQPPARLPEADRRSRARLRPLPPHRLGHPPQRPPAGVRQVAQAADLCQLLAHEAPRDHQRDHGYRRGRPRGQGQARRRGGPRATRASSTSSRPGTSSRTRSRGSRGTPSSRLRRSRSRPRCATSSTRTSTLPRKQPRPQPAARCSRRCPGPRR